MAIELCSENSVLGVSPRISFSHDLSQTDVIPVEQNHSSSTIDFDFHVRESFDQDSSSADELFSDGKILPVQIKKKISKSKQLDQSIRDSSSDENSKKESSKEIIKAGEEKQSSKSFWRFKRSSSLNCGTGYARSLCPIPLLSRSNSTGSASCNVKRSSGSLAKDAQNHNQKQQHSHKHSSFGSVKSTQSSSFGSYQKPPLKKSYGSYGNVNAVQISPVLHVPSASLFGFGLIFSNGKDKNKKK